MIQNDSRAFRLAKLAQERKDLIAARDWAAHLMQCQQVGKLTARLYAVTHAILAEGGK
ncbi:hypothetical protein [Falsirhodobacter xinxiangensis]|uniref:hypothetical protein n=1 Tax=Falsirhodobacter xinxiangensis TaxID=2530049 RepID=UPI00145A6368|nr:hypothetical protein [Rhodobacter xinxiangensis]